MNQLNRKKYSRFRFVSAPLSPINENAEIRRADFPFAKELEKTKYPVRALRYWWMHRVIEEEAERIGKPVKIADVGCDRGIIKRFIPPIKDARWIGLDIDTNREGIALANYDELLKCDFNEGIPLPAASVDIAICSHVLEHLPRPEFTLGEIAKIVRPGGMILVGVPIAPKFIADFREKQFAKELKSGKRKLGQHIQMFSIKRLHRLATEHGLQIEFSSGTALLRKKAAVWKITPLGFALTKFGRHFFRLWEWNYASNFANRRKYFMHEANQKLKQITEEILFSGNDFGRQYSACNELYKFFAQLTGVSHSSKNADDAAQTILPNGKAISPKEAAHCVLDFARTTQFLRGIYAAILELKKRFPHKKLEILYAGCGPFAALIVPLLTQFTTEDFSLTLIDFHQRSIDAAKSVFQKLHLEKFVADFVRTDASNFQHKEKLHLVICETMQNTLQKEPQAAITLNLAPQLAENGIFVPQKISVEVCLANLSKEFATDGAEKERIYLGEILKLEAEKIRQSSTQNFRFPAITLEIPPINFANADFMLLTKILIFDKFELNEYDSGISYPLVLNDLRDSATAKNRIEFQYIMDKNPRFEYRLIKV